MKRRLIDWCYKLFRGLFYFARCLKLISVCRRIKSVFFSAILSNEFKSCGDNLSVFTPFYIIGNRSISIGNNFSAFGGLRLEAYSHHLGQNYQPVIEIGDNVSINFDCHIACINKIVIGNNVLLASKIFITDHFHGEVNSSSYNVPPSERPLFSKGPVIIEDNVWIGEGAVIMPNVTIGECAIVGANSVVTKSFPPYSVIAGNPAVLIKNIK